MRYVVDDLVKVPKAQVERVVGPILGLFIAQAFSQLLRDEVEMVCPEFPLRKKDSNQSTNLDWLLYARNRDLFVLVELKTTDTTYREDQANIYREIVSPIERDGIAHLVADVETIRSASRERGKYDNVLSRVRKPEYLQCKKAALVYLAPKCSHPDETMAEQTVQGAVTAQCIQALRTGDSVWLSFGDLPEDLPSRFAGEWRIIRNWLVQLDPITRRSRNGMNDDTGQRNFSGTCTFDELIRRCENDPDGIVIGYDGGISKLSAATLDELHRRPSYKWDHALDGTGHKDGRNWIPGRRFLEVVDTLRRTRGQG
jgi:hypothetical protein